MGDRQVADLVDDEECGSAEPADALAQQALALGLGEGTDDIGKGGEVDAAAGLDRLDAERHGEMRFAGAGGPKEVDDLAAIDELELGEGEDALAIERRLEGEVEAGEGLDRGETPHAQRGLDAAGLAHAQLLGEQRVDQLESAGFAAFELAHGMIEQLQRPWHSQRDQGPPDALQHGYAVTRRGHDRPLSAASRRATAS